jgi:hypothetical protein
MLCFMAKMFAVGFFTVRAFVGSPGGVIYLVSHFTQLSKTRISPHTFFYQGRISSSSHTYVAVRGVSSNSTSESERCEAMTQLVPTSLTPPPATFRSCTLRPHEIVYYYH